MNATGAVGAVVGHAPPHDKVMPVATVMAAESPMIVTPLYEATVVLLVTPVPEILHPTHGGVAGTEVKLIVVDDVPPGV